MRKRGLVYGKGVNDADYIVVKIVDGKRIKCPFYKKWEKMLERAYSDKWHIRQPTYKDVTVCKEWHSFMAFRSWMMQQDWKDKHLDKDIIKPGNKEYGPKNCCFVSQAVNNTFFENADRRGQYPQGVSYDKRKRKFVSSVKIANRRKNIGRYNTPEEAHYAYVVIKCAHIRELKDKEYNTAVRRGMDLYIGRLKKDAIKKISI